MTVKGPKGSWTNGQSRDNATRNSVNSVSWFTLLLRVMGMCFLVHWYLSFRLLIRYQFEVSIWWVVQPEQVKPRRPGCALPLRTNHP